MYLYMFVCVCMFVCVYVCVFVCACVCVCADIWMVGRMFVCVCGRTTNVDTSGWCYVYACGQCMCTYELHVRANEQKNTNKQKHKNVFVASSCPQQSVVGLAKLNKKAEFCRLGNFPA